MVQRNFLISWLLAMMLTSATGCSGGGGADGSVSPEGVAEVSVGEGDRAVWLTWEVPGHGVAGEPLNDLDGFAVYYAKEGAVDKESPRRAIGNVNRCKVTGLTEGRFVFRVTALTLGGLESAQSEAAAIVLE